MSVEIDRDTIYEKLFAFTFGCSWSSHAMIQLVLKGFYKYLMSHDVYVSQVTTKLSVTFGELGHYCNSLTTFKTIIQKRD